MSENSKYLVSVGVSRGTSIVTLDFKYFLDNTLEQPGIARFTCTPDELLDILLNHYKSIPIVEDARIPEDMNLEDLREKEKEHLWRKLYDKEYN